MTSTDEALAGARRELEDVEARRAAASSTMMSASSDPDAFARARAERDRLAAECERLELHIGSLEERRQQEQEDARAERRRRLEEEASSLNEQITGLAVAGLDLTLRLGAILHEVERLRERAMAVNQRLNPTQVYPVAAEPEGLYRVLAGCTNAARRACTFSKMGLETERQLPLPEGKDHGDQAAA